MKLTILGSGTCVPSIKRASPSILLDISKIKVLLDIGPGTLRQLARLDPKAYQKIDIVYLSHWHLDHTSDLGSLVQALNWTPGFKRKKTLHIATHPKTKLFIKNILNKGLYYKIKFHSLDANNRICGIKFKTQQGNHDATSLMVQISHNNKNLVYTGDTSFNPDIVKIANECNLLITENSFPAPMKEDGHLNSCEAAEMAKLAKAKTLLLTHLYPPSDKVNVKKQVKKIYKGKVIIARDLLKIDL